MPAPKELLRWASDNEGAPSLAIFERRSSFVVPTVPWELLRSTTDEGAPPLAIFERRSSLVEIARALYTHNAGAPSFAFVNEGAPALG